MLLAGSETSGTSGTLPATTTQSGLAGQVGVNWVQWMVERRDEGGREGGREGGVCECHGIIPPCPALGHHSVAYSNPVSEFHMREESQLSSSQSVNTTPWTTRWTSLPGAWWP